MISLKLSEDRCYEVLISVLIAISFFSLFNEVMEPDGALYASISKNMILRNDWLNLYVHGKDWLDKPHLPFWLAAASFKLFGISAFAYKLPSFLINLMGTFYLYRFTADHFNRKTALISAIIFLTSLHVLISNSDVRAEAYLAAFVTAAIYHYDRARQKSFLHIVAGSFFAACAVMVKGIFVLVPIFCGFIIYWAITRQLKELLKPKWWIAITLILIFITPELYSLYVQFDLHPEKTVFGQQGVSGLRFFFWDSQFGRFFNTGPIKGKGDLSFFLHTTLWAFLPWSVLFYVAVINLFKKSLRIVLPPETIIIWSSAFITFLLFSFSKFQLPHYILVIFPQFSIITALYLMRISEKRIKTFLIIQNVIFLIVVLLLGTIAVCFKFQFYGAALAILLIAAVSTFLLFKGASIKTIVSRGAVLSIGIMSFLYLFFYPSILKYQSGMEAGKWLQANDIKAIPAVFRYDHAFSFDFYANKEVKYLYDDADLEETKDQKETVIYTHESELPYLKSKYNLEILKQFDYYHITKLKAKFILAKSRPSVLEHFYLVKIK
ncbi:glycosyltransferase family 39 protein [Pedobacter panaciterrae]|uniref:ArnT family glycosyltransferase n=1 Tax=Pedobacter panaciterrae TaxID=363849 RepID=UPI00155DDD2F|nr:glycosyltransferase family 39 protein [Pedobacter panaciterrae]NQX56594.1 glycosyltransferase family 39 protein [Pedobacter panaciterrae]